MVWWNVFVHDVVYLVSSKYNSTTLVSEPDLNMQWGHLKDDFMVYVTFGFRATAGLNMFTVATILHNLVINVVG